MQVDSIKTPRLIGERVRRSHWQYWLTIGSNHRVMATMGGVWNDSKARQKMQSNYEHWQLHGHSHYI